MKLKKLASTLTVFILAISNLAYTNLNTSIDTLQNRVIREHEIENIEESAIDEIENIDRMHTKLILSSLKSKELNESEQSKQVKLIKQALKKFTSSNYMGLKSSERDALETEILQYIVDRNMGHDPLPQYYASINIDMKTESYVRNNYGIEINDNIEDSVKYLINDIEKVIIEKNLAKFDVIEKIVSLLTLESNEELILLADEKLGLGLKYTLNSKIESRAYNETTAMAYADKWDGYKRNPEYRDFSSLGGDCANLYLRCCIYLPFIGGKIYEQ